MSVLTVDSISERTLPALDNLFRTDKDKLTSVIMSTHGEPLRRLLLASIARHTLLGLDDSTMSNTARLLETFIKENLNGATDLATMNSILDLVGPDAEKVMLSTSIARFNMLS